MISKMIFTVLSYTDLSPLMELDDFISAIWNNKYYEAGEFEIICQTNGERLTKIVRNNYITLNGTTEIGVITSIQFSKDEDQGAIMTIKGSFAHALLNRRIIWDKKTIDSNIDTGIRDLINDNALAPADSDRKITVDLERGSASGEDVMLVEFESMKEIDIVGGYEITNPGTPSDGIISGFAADKTSIYGLQVYYGPDIYAVYLIYFENASTGDREQYLWTNPLSEKDPTSLIWESGKGCYIYSYCKCAILRDLLPYSKMTLNTNYFLDTTNYVMRFYIDLADEPSDQEVICTKLVNLTKDQFESGGYGIALYDKKLHFRIKFGSARYNWAKDQAGGLEWASSQDEYLFTMVVHGYVKSTEVPDSYKIITADDYVLYDTPKQSKIALKPKQILSSGDIRDFSINEFVAPVWMRLYPEAIAGGYIYASYTVKVNEMADYLALGDTVGITASGFSLEVYGDNLLDKSAEILKTYGAAIKARYVKVDKKIYLDIYSGKDRARGTSDPVIYTENFDNLNSYEVASANVEANSALVYSEQDGTEYKAAAGIDAGFRRFETFINKKDSPGYTGADYQAQLEADGTITLTGLSLAITADVDTRAYSYRDEGGFSLGDIVTIIINDLNLEYNVRVLEVREYQDETGYNIDLVLGE